LGSNDYTLAPTLDLSHLGETPTSKALRVTGAHKPQHHVKEVVLEEENIFHTSKIYETKATLFVNQ
jgi:hypothetical protein